MITIHIDANGNQLRSTTDPDVIVPGAVETTTIPPISGKQKWHGTGWDDLPAIPKTVPSNANSVPSLRDDFNALLVLLQDKGIVP